LATDSHQLCEEKIYMIRGAMESFVYGAGKVSSTKHSQFQVYLHTARRAATTWSDADGQKAIERLAREFHHVTPAKFMLVKKLFQHGELQLLQGVRTETTCPRNIFAKHLAVMKTVAQHKANGGGET
jgi:hypothetical protein